MKEDFLLTFTFFRKMKETDSVRLNRGISCCCIFPFDGRVPEAQ